MAALEASVEGIPSLIGRLERLSSLPVPGDRFRQKLQQQTFSAWLALSPCEQLGDLRAYFHGSGCDTRLAASEECYRTLVPPVAADGEKRLFSCGLQVALASLGNENGSGRTLVRMRVGRMLELAQQHHGNLSLEDVSQSVGGSGRHLARIFTHRTGVTFRRYSLWLRMLRAVELLREPADPVKSIAGRLGYAEPSNFVREFHRTLGTTPSELRERLSIPGGGGA